MASIITRITTWAAGQVLKAADLNGEFNNIVNLLNNLDSASTTWDNVKTTTLTPLSGITLPGNLTFSSTSTQGIVGTTASDSAASGNVGERVSATVNNGSTVSFTSNTWTNITTISLTAGDWEVWGNIGFGNNGALIASTCQGALSLFSGVTTTDHVVGGNVIFGFPGNNVTDGISAVNCFRVSVTTTTTVYLKGIITVSAGASGGYGHITARRMR